MIIKTNDYPPAFIESAKGDGVTIFNDLVKLDRGNMICIAARPGMGKTSLALHMALEFAKKSDKTVYFFTLEMSAKQIYQRIISYLAEVDSHKLYNNSFSTEQKEAVKRAEEYLRTLNIVIDDEPMLPVEKIEERLEKENERKYGEVDELVSVLEAGTGKKGARELTGTFRDFYEKNNVAVPKKATAYSDKDTEILARADAEEIIRGGYDEVVEELDRLSSLGANRMTAREKALYLALSENRVSTERARELESIGVTADVYNSKEFQDYANMFKSDMPIKVIYDNYVKTLPKKEFKTPESMKSTIPEDNGIKDFYSHEEASKFTKEDFDKNPALYNAVVNSMQKWK